MINRIQLLSEIWQNSIYKITDNKVSDCLENDLQNAGCFDNLKKIV